MDGGGLRPLKTYNSSLTEIKTERSGDVVFIFSVELACSEVIEKQLCGPNRIV